MTATSKSSFIQSILRLFQGDSNKTELEREAREGLLRDAGDHDKRKRRHSAPSRSFMRRRILSGEHSSPTPNFSRSLSENNDNNLSAPQGPDGEVSYTVLRAYPKSDRKSLNNRSVNLGCTSPDCACNIVKRYTASLNEKDRVMKELRTGTAGDASVSFSTGSATARSSDVKDLVTRSNNEDQCQKDAQGASTIPDDKKTVERNDEKDVTKSESSSRKTRHISLEGGCSPKCSCHVVKEYTAQLLKQDRESKRTSTSDETALTARMSVSPAAPVSMSSPRPTCVPLNEPKNQSQASQTDTSKSVNPSRAESGQNTGIESPPIKTAGPNKIIFQPEYFETNENSINEINFTRKMKKPKHKTKRVFVKKGFFRRRNFFTKYKSLVEYRESMTDIQQAMIDDWERQREKKKDKSRVRKDQMSQRAMSAFESQSSRWQRRRAKVPYFSSYPKGQSAPPLPVLMNRLPNPPECFIEKRQ